jgi:predicted phosphoribosyltransferase
MNIILDSNNTVVFAGGTMPTSHTGNEFTLGQIPEGEVFDPNCSYTVAGGIAIKGNVIPRDLDEETRMEVEYQAIKYQTDREYPSISDQLDMIFHAGLGGDEFQAAIQAVKDSHPKPI